MLASQKLAKRFSALERHRSCHLLGTGITCDNYIFIGFQHVVPESKIAGLLAIWKDDCRTAKHKIFQASRVRISRHMQEMPALTRKQVRVYRFCQRQASAKL